MAVTLGPDVVIDSMAECIDNEMSEAPADGHAPVVGAASTAGLRFGGIFAEVARQLRAGGVGFLAIFEWFNVIMALIKEYGPQVAEIVKRILEAIREGRKPDAVLAEMTTPAAQSGAADPPAADESEEEAAKKGRHHKKK